MRTLFVTALVALAAAAPASAGQVRTLQQVYAINQARSVRIEFDAGELRIEAVPGSKLRANVEASCRHDDDECLERAERVRLAGSFEGQTFVLRVQGVPKLSHRGLELGAVFQVPRDLPLDVKMGAGDLEIRDLAEDVDVELGVGEVNLHLRNGDVGSVRMHVGVGDATLRQDGHTVEGSGWLGKKLHWTGGSGDGRVTVELGVGDAEVTLR